MAGKKCPGAIAALALLALALPCLGQQVDSEFTLLGNRFRLDRPAGMTVSPAGDRIAVSDLGTNLIVVVDLEGRLLWTAGESVRLDQPRAVSLASETQLIFSPENTSLILSVNEENPRVIDTVVDLSSVADGDLRVSQIIRRRDGTYLVLDSDEGRIVRFSDEWDYEGEFIPHGSGKGKVLRPSAMAVSGAGRVVISDYKNFPVQVFDSFGKSLFHAGWNIPADSRGWEAAAIAVDSRDFVWAADETNAMFRIYDQSGTQLTSVPFRNSAVSAVAMTGTIDNRMAVLDETGTLLFYTLE